MKTMEVMERIAATARESKAIPREFTSEILGEGARQGDIELLFLGHAKTPKAIQTLVNKLRESAGPLESVLKALPEKLGKPTNVRQLAVGDTQGSRHVATGVTTVYAIPEGAHALVGPVVVSDEPWVLTHPEHGHIKFPSGCFQVLYQRDYASERAEEIRRVAD